MNRCRMRRIGLSLVIGWSAVTLVTIVAIWLLHAAWFPKEATRDEVRRAAQPLIAAVERFRTERGRLPGSLQELTPQYLVALTPPPIGAKRWEYETLGQGNGHEYFSVSVHLRRETIVYRTDLPDGWFFCDSDF
jgi:hypothetical protein